MHDDSVGAFPRAVARSMLPLALPSVQAAAALLGTAVAVVAALLGLWLVPMGVLVLLVTWTHQRRRLLVLAAPRCAAVAAVDRSDNELGEAIIVADLAACAADRRILRDAQARVLCVHDPWRRLLAERRLSLALEQVRAGGSTAPVLVTAGLAVVFAAGFAWSVSRSWLLLAVACVVPLTLALLERRPRPAAAAWLATKAALDPLEGGPPSESEFVHLLELLATGDQRVLLIAARDSPPGGLAQQRLVHAAAECPR
jgi:hypothetical protein